MHHNYTARNQMLRQDPNNGIVAFMAEYAHRHGTRMFSRADFGHITSLNHGGYGFDAEPTLTTLKECVLSGLIAEEHGQTNGNDAHYALTKSGKLHYAKLLNELAKLNPELYNDPTVTLNQVRNALNAELGESQHETIDRVIGLLKPAAITLPVSSRARL
jgi:hypothetical protein